MKRLDSDIENILNSFDGIQQAEPAPYMYTRIMGRLQNREKNLWERIGFFMARPVVILAGFLILIAANYYVISTDSGNQEVSVTASNSASEILQNDNYILAVNNYESKVHP